MTGGFFAKFYVFSAAVKSGLIWLTIIGVLNSGIGAYYYLRIIVMMYMRESRKEVPVTRVPFALAIALATCMAATLYLGLFPSGILQRAQEAAQQFVLHAQPDTPASAGVLPQSEVR
jgi:NADH-quinone oxidoreductase subunit N